MTRHGGAVIVRMLCFSTVERVSLQSCLNVRDMESDVSKIEPSQKVSEPLVSCFALGFNAA